MSTGAIGEYFVLCELMRMGYTCLRSPDPTNMGWDLVVYDRDANVGVTIEVKTVRWPDSTSSTKPVLSGNFSATYDFLVIVILSLEDVDYLVYVVPKEDVISFDNQNSGGIPQDAQGKFRFTRDTIPLSKFPYAREYLDSAYGRKWNLVVDCLKHRSNQQRFAAPQPVV